MKNILNGLNEGEKNRILEMHNRLSGRKINEDIKSLDGAPDKFKEDPLKIDIKSLDGAPDKFKEDPLKIDIISLDGAPDDFSILRKSKIYAIPHEDVDNLFVVKNGPRNRYNFIRKLGDKYVSYSDIFKVGGSKVISGNSIKEVLSKIK